MADHHCQQLTAREVHILQAIVDNGTMPLAAKRLGLSLHTVDAHVDSVRTKTGRQKLIQIVAWAAQEGYIRVDASDI